MKFVFGIGSKDENSKQITSPIEEDEETSNSSEHRKGSDSRNNSTSSADEEVTFHDSYQYLESDQEADFHSAYGGSPIGNSPSYKSSSEHSRTTLANVFRNTNGESLPTEGTKPLGGKRSFETENLNISDHSNGTVHTNVVNSGSNLGKVQDEKAKRSCCLPICGLSFKLKRKHKSNST